MSRTVPNHESNSVERDRIMSQTGSNLGLNEQVQIMGRTGSNISRTTNHGANRVES